MTGPATPGASRSPERGPRRVVVAAVGGATALGLAVAVALPIVLDGRRSSAAQDLRTDLQRVASAQAAWRDEHGGYSTSLQDLRVAPTRTDVAIVSAGQDAFCVGAYDEVTRTTLFSPPRRRRGAAAPADEVLRPERVSPRPTARAPDLGRRWRSERRDP